MASGRPSISASSSSSPPSPTSEEPNLQEYLKQSKLPPILPSLPIAVIRTSSASSQRPNTSPLSPASPFSPTATTAPPPLRKLTAKNNNNETNNRSSSRISIFGNLKEAIKSSSSLAQLSNRFTLNRSKSKNNIIGSNDVDKKDLSEKASAPDLRAGEKDQPYKRNKASNPGLRVSVNTIHKDASEHSLLSGAPRKSMKDGSSPLLKKSFSFDAIDIKNSKSQDIHIDIKDDNADISDYDYYSVSEEDDINQIADYQYYSDSDNSESFETSGMLSLENAKEKSKSQAAVHGSNVQVHKKSSSAGDVSSNHNLNNSNTEHSGITEGSSHLGSSIFIKRPETAGPSSSSTKEKNNPFRRKPAERTGSIVTLSEVKPVVMTAASAVPEVIDKDEMELFNGAPVPRNRRKTFQYLQPIQRKGLVVTKRDSRVMLMEEAKEYEELDGTRHFRIPRLWFNGKMSKKGIPKVLMDPQVRKQIMQMKRYKPYFTYGMIVVTGIVMLLQLIHAQIAMNEMFQTNPFNIMLGPRHETLILLGGRFIPCMKSGFENATYDCARFFPLDYKNINSSSSPANTIPKSRACSNQRICSFFNTQKETNQLWRFLTAMFLHGGILHYVMNSITWWHLARGLEEVYGPWRIGVVYFLSGFGGFMFGSNFTTYIVTVGASGAIYGILGCVLMDLLLNFKLIPDRWKKLGQLLLMIFLYLAVGLLPIIDNYAHIGGFIIGLISALYMLKPITFNERDRKIKMILKYISIPLLVAAFLYLFFQFFAEGSCPWCKYADCLPVFGWCDNIK